VPSSTIVDLDRLSLAHGEGARLELPVALGALELGGQRYELAPDPVPAHLDVSRPSRGHAFHLVFPLVVEGPCVRCLEPARVEAEVDSREVDQRDAEDEELRSPYVSEDGQRLELGRWAHDAAILALPARILCRTDCAGLCPVCGASLNDADPADHEHGGSPDPRWAKLDELKRD
jgi:DUF177 domain-containing protein